MKSLALILPAIASLLPGQAGAKAKTAVRTAIERPNVVLIMTDDQGYGDFGVTGNPILQTPHIDRLAGSSAGLKNFYVCPVCAPTRASLMTGRYHYRTRVVDTWNGRAMMDSAEVTVAEVLRDAGYSTAIFGKWHLGDCYPLRPQDQGFDLALVHRGGGIGQSSDPVGGERQYTDAVLFENGVRTETSGYCTDVYFARAMEWIEGEHRGRRPFFAYIATNAPHGPFHDVPQALYDKYRALNLADDQFPQESGHRLSGPASAKKNLDRRARIFAMIENIDQNVGRLLGKLEQLDLTRNTIVMFLTDNGPNGSRYVAGMRGMKTHVHEGGIRSPFWCRWPGHFTPGHSVTEVTAHIDVMPTILDACNVAVPEGVRLDGRSVLPLLSNHPVDQPDRTIYIQAHRGDVPTPLHHFAARSKHWKLVHPSGFGRESSTGEPQLELYDMRTDPFEQRDVAAQNPAIVARMRRDYMVWFEDVSSTRTDNYDPPRIRIGSRHEPVTCLTRQDWRRFGPEHANWGNHSTGYWLLDVERAGDFAIHMRFRAVENDGERLSVSFGGKSMAVSLADNSREMTFEFRDVPAGLTRLDTEIARAGGKRVRGVLMAEIVRR